MKVVLVDDEVKFVSMLAKRLTLRGYEVAVANDGEQALKMVAKKRFDIAVLDLKMPGIGGVELKEKMAAVDDNLKYIFVTGHGSIDNREKPLKSDDIYLSKPLDIDILIGTFQKVFGGE